MAHRLRPEGLGFLTTAPVRLVFTEEISAAPEQVFSALAEDVAGWAAWFPAVTSARPVDDGAGRDVRLRGGTRFRESVLLAKEPEVYAYRVDVTNAPGARALIEEWRLTPSGSGTRVRWTFAADGTVAFRGLLRLARPGMGRSFRGAVTRLDRRIAGRV
ncbi:SRPBCC family protein [Streptomyces bobili]|uniref:SRPBCC family protein n=1 Tax=Streptomyces TaxID=1883 RepID=UPI0022582DB9|nr:MULTISPECIES: SRPBCC family protein [Streptomyces]MCX5522019.1 SRPBCC family protein [Streptomyces bobili]MDX3569023.1 SRPBCC family protein [Streptomyces sp. ID05-47C]